MAQGTTSKTSPRGLVRLAMRLPIWLYRLRLGWLLGGRFLMLTHIGRKSGLPRQVVLEVVRHDRASDTYIVASGWGERADWFRNIQRNAHVVRHTGTRRIDAVAERLPVEAAADELCDYARRHPRAFRALAQLMVGEAISASAQNCRMLAQRVPLVALRPRKS